MTHAYRVLTLGVSAIALIFGASSTFSQTSNEKKSDNPLEIVVTPNRSPTAIQRTGSAVSVVSSETIASSNPASLADALRSVPGLDLTETGQPGSPLNVRIRGASANKTLVLIDGMRVNDPSSTEGEFDFASIAPGLIDRIEVLRGPQSAIYGSDALGGVVNIITKRGRGPLQGYAQIEGGSYGTISSNTGVYGSKDAWNYSFATSQLKSEGFSSYGYRVKRVTASNPNLEKDGTERWGGFGRIGYDPGTGFRFETSLMSTRTRVEYDPGFGAQPDGASAAIQRSTQGWARAELDTFDTRLTHQLSVFANRTSRNYDALNAFGHSKYDYFGTRVGVEYQNTLKMDALGRLTLGGKMERESIEGFSEDLAPFPLARSKTIGKSQSTRSLFVLWQGRFGDNTDLSLGGRYDDVVDITQFLTWRATLAHRLPAFDTKLRASIGTGGKAPALDQLYSPFAGNPNLRPERSLGVDIGVDQPLLDGRATLSLTGFYNTFKDLIDYRATGPFTGNYFNVSQAETSGVELALDARLMPDLLRLRAAYTYMKAKDLNTGLTLARRPEHVGKFTLSITPNAQWTVEPRLTLFSQRYSTPGALDRLAPYARLDIHTDYKLNATFTLHARAENITNARYQEVMNFGTTGRAVYGGLKATW
jgi:vitamin B12 transporter